ncbi:MAG: MBOAT family protein [Ruminiclostridium sp.]|nr:MBOAT family protein [Ruminiclostridium sp.]
MLFNSLQYAVFLVLAVFIYFILPFRFRWIFLLGASYFFYMCWNAKYALLMLLSTVITYLASILIFRTKGGKLRAFYLIFSLVINLGILFLFKYFNFFNETAADLMLLLGVEYQPVRLSLLLPVGISFYTFQAVGYSIDVYTGKSKPQTHFGKYALFVSFFPQLVAGPIERIENLYPQFNKNHRFDFDRMKSGLLMIAQGLVKKVVIADRLAVLVNTVYNSPDRHQGFHFVVATAFFAFQIYCDFSGYSDIAVGSARILGFELMQNFRRPYLAVSIGDFWKRWHVSLTTWFRDNVYIALGGNRKRHLTNIMVVFLASGLWHGANLTFIIWGFLNGIYQVAGIKLKPLFTKIRELFGINNGSFLHNGIRRIITFILVCFAWIFFRANSPGDTWLILSKLFVWNASFFENINSAAFGMDKADLLVSTAMITALMVYESIQERLSMGAFVRNKPLVVRWLVYAAVFVLILLFGIYGDSNGEQFIYFQF